MATGSIITTRQQVAQKHYLQVTDDHYQRAVTAGAKSGAQVVHNPAQQAHAPSRRDSPTGQGDGQQTVVPSEVRPRGAGACDPEREKMAEVHGNRTHQPYSPKEAVFPEGGAESGALFGDDERLRLLLEAWADLPESVKEAVMEMVRG